MASKKDFEMGDECWVIPKHTLITLLFMHEKMFYAETRLNNSCM